MAFELYNMLAGNVSPMTGETVKPAYGGEEEAFLRKIITPIYQVIAKVLGYTHLFKVSVSYISVVLMYNCIVCDLVGWQEAERSRKGKSKHSQWRNYDDLNEYFWYFSISSVAKLFSS